MWLVLIFAMLWVVAVSRRCAWLRSCSALRLLCGFVTQPRSSSAPPLCGSVARRRRYTGFTSTPASVSAVRILPANSRA